MAFRHVYSSRPQARRTATAVAGLVALSLGSAACSATAGEDASPVPGGDASATPSSSAPPVSEASISTNLPKRKRVAVDKAVELTVQDGTFDQVRVTIGKGKKRLAGDLSEDSTRWTAKQRLEPGRAYHVHAVAVDDQGVKAVNNSVFRTDNLTLDEQTYPSIAPLEGETVGVGMPVIVQFDVPVKNKASIEKHLSVESTPHQVGAWHWISDNEVHWRPRSYWKPGTDVTVDADINSVAAGNGVFGQMSRSASFHIGDSVVSKVDVDAHRLKVFINGSLARSVPISAGKPGYITRSGTKVIIEKIRHKTMDAASIGISKNDPEYYRLEVEYAMRVTYSGEFLHAAPWSSGSQGFANVSHGCVGMSTENAAWLFNLTKRGDVVEVTGSDRYMTLTNGYGDWNESFAEYKQGSAL